MGAVFSVGMVRSAQGLEGLLALYLPTPEQSRLVITQPGLKLAAVNVTYVLNLPQLVFSLS